MDEAIEFLRAFVQAEFQAKHANYSEPDDKKLIQLIRAHDAMYAPPLRSGLSRPLKDPPRFFETPEQVQAAARQHPRGLFAVARYRCEELDVYRAWLGDTEVRPRGEGLRQNLYLAERDGKLKVVSRYQVCSNCQGSKQADSGRACGACDATGWLFRGGIEWLELGAPVELRKLQPPTDPLAQPAWDAIEE